MGQEAGTVPVRGNCGLKLVLGRALSIRLEASWEMRPMGKMHKRNMLS